MIPKVTFKFDKEEDMKTIWETCNTKQYSYGTNFKELVTKNIIRICQGKKFGESKNELRKVMKDMYESPIIDIIVNSFNKGWKKIDKEYFKRLEKIMKYSFDFKEIPVYLTNSPRCPYDPDKKHPSFHSHLYSNLFGTLGVAMHELMHIQFHNSKYWKICEKELGNKQTHDLKEALTVLLNLEFKDLMIWEDQGYPTHKELRNFIAKEWKKKKDFDKLINSSIKWIKKNGVK